MKDDTISRAAAIDAMMKLQADDIEAYGASIPEGFDGDRAVTAIKALPSAQPTGTKTVQVEDCISRQAAINALGEEPPVWYDGEDEIAERNQWRRDVAAIKALSSAQPGWIPWDSGKFPEESGCYIVTAYDGSGSRVTFAKYQKRLKRWELTGARAYWRVLAWQPLPTPYREGGQK